MNKLNVALIDDDKNFSTLMSEILSKEFTMKIFHNPSIPMSDIQESDAILLDVHLGIDNGFNVCRSLKSIRNDLPIFFLTSDDDIKKISEAYQLGVTDYFSKNISTDELIIRLKSRLLQIPRAARNHLLHCRDITLDSKARRIFVKEREICLSPKEFEIFKTFMEHQDEVLSKPEILSILWKDISVGSNNIDTHMFHIRRKFDGITTGIECRKGVGYILRSHL